MLWLSALLFFCNIQRMFIKLNVPECISHKALGYHFNKLHTIIGIKSSWFDFNIKTLIQVKRLQLH